MDYDEDMRVDLSADEVTRYQTNGFIVVEDFLSPEELERWRTCTEEAVAERLALKVGHLTNQTDPSTYYAQVFTQCLKLAETHLGMHELLHDPALGQFIATLAGVDGIRIWHDQALFKPPYGNPTGWHLDNPYWSFSSRDSLSIWIALDDATLGNGCLWYVPGTHLTARYENAGIGMNQGDLFTLYPEWTNIETVACPARAGSAVIHNGLVAHGAGANMTCRPRRAMTCAYMPDGSTFNGVQNVLPTEYFESLQIGDLLNDEDVNPLIWKR